MVANILRRTKQTGDTIVEVLIAMTVAASVLGITYATMNRNLLLTRDSQERTEAAKLAQGQIEALRYVYNNAALAATLPAAGLSFCLNGSSVKSVGWGPSTPNASLTADVFSRYPATCVSGFYNYAIVQDGAAPGLYRFYVRWDRVVGVTRDQIIMVYKVN